MDIPDGNKTEGEKGERNGRQEGNGNHSEDDLVIELGAEEEKEEMESGARSIHVWRKWGMKRQIVALKTSRDKIPLYEQGVVCCEA